MKKSMVKILTAALAAATVASMSVMPVFAQNTVVPTWTGSDYVAADPEADPPVAEQTGTARKTIDTITVTDLRETDNLEVTAYQIVKGTYKDGRLTGYVLCDFGKDADDNDLTIADMENPTAEEITAIAQNINANKSSLTGIVMTQDNTDDSKYTARVEAGLYIVLARGADSVVYNPAIVAVNVKDAHLVADATEGGTVSMGAESYFNIPEAAYLKSSESGFDKNIVGSHKPDEATIIDPVNGKGDTVAFGDIVQFKLDEMTIPSYSDEFTNIEYKVVDNLDADSFKRLIDFKVKVNDTEVAATTEIPAANPDDDPTVVNNYTLKLFDEEGQETNDFDEAVGYSVAFTNDFIKAHGTNAVEISYSSEFLSTAGINYAENKNHAVLTYSNDASDPASRNTKKATTYHYSFGIDADVDAQDPGNSETYEFNKVTQALKDGETYENAENEDGTGTRKSPYALTGATFALYVENETVTHANPDNILDPADDVSYLTQIKEAVSDDNGHIKFTGLDEGVYYIKETHAPRGYTLNDNIYKVTIDAELSGAGIMTEYTITTQLKVNGVYQTVGTCTYSNELIDETNPDTQEVTPAVDPNTGAVKNTITADIAPVEIVDPRIAALPSTGGIGTIVITVVASIGMAGFLTLYIVNRKKKKEESDKK